MNTKHESPEHPYAETLRSLQRAVAEVDAASIEAVEYASAEIYPDSNPQRLLAQGFIGDTSSSAWDININSRWRKSFIDLVQFTNLELASMQLSAASPPSIPLEVHYFNQIINPTGHLPVAVDRLHRQMGQYNSSSNIRLVSELKVAQLYRQHRGVRLYGNEFCTNPLLTQPHRLNSMLDELEGGPTELSDRDNILHSQVQAMATAIGLPVDELTGILLARRSKLAMEGYEVERADILADIYIAAIRKDIEKYETIQEAETRVGKFANQLLSAVQLRGARTRAKAIGHSAAKSLLKTL